MIHSMTAYARIEHKADWGTASWEIRSVNQRYLETYLRLPEQFRSLEPVLRDRLRKRLNRGKVEVNLRYELSDQQGTQLNMNQDLALQLLQAANWVKQQAGQGDRSGQKQRIERQQQEQDQPDHDAVEISSELAIDTAQTRPFPTADAGDQHQ